MRLRAVSRLIQTQDVCIFCSFRPTIERSTPRRSFLSQSRLFSNNGPLLESAQAALAEEKEEEYEPYVPPMFRENEDRRVQAFPAPKDPPQPPLSEMTSNISSQNWQCGCGNINLARRDRCTRCRKPRPAAGEPSRLPRNFDRSEMSEVNSGTNRAYKNPRSDQRSEWRSLETTRSKRDPRYPTNEELPENRFTIQRYVTKEAPDGGWRKGFRDQSLSDQERTDWRPRGNSEGLARPSILRVRGERRADLNAGRTEAFEAGELERNHMRNYPHRRERQTATRREHLAPSDASPIALPSVAPLEFSAFAEGRERERAKAEREIRRKQRLALDDADPQVDQRTSNRKPIRADRANPARGIDDLEEIAPDEFSEGSRRRKTRGTGKMNTTKAYAKPQLQLPDFISVERLAQILKVRVEILINELEKEGFEGARYDHVLDAETSSMFAELHGFEPLLATTSGVEDLVGRPPAEDKSALPPRPPIVTIMGHVDHGKTTILDWLRKTSVVASEHGGITQHIGAFSFTMPGSKKQITFLDTPGHAAFLEMRRRGANVTDIVVLVVAADDSVKPQTIEAIKHALEAKVPIIVAINKMDKAEANVERVKQDLSQHHITVEDWGGDYQAVAVSGKTGQGMQELEEAILLLAEVSDFRAETDGPTEGWVIESKVTTAGRVATVLVKRGTLRAGDIIVAGTTWSRVRTLRTDAGNLVDAAPPGMPVQVDGWRGDPSAGLEVLQAESEDHAKDVVDLRLENEESLKAATDMAAITVSRNEEAEARARVLRREAEERELFQASKHGKRRYIPAKENEGWIENEKPAGPAKVHFVIKADVAGSVEALVAAVSAIGNNEVVANVIHSGPGLVTESDVRHLAATGEKGYLISFNQPIEPSAARLADAAGLQILDHNVIYKATDDVKAKLSAALPPVVTQRVLGEAEVGQIFEISLKRGKLKVAGCKVTNGTIDRSHKIRVLRSGEIIYTGTLDSLKNVKKDVTEMRKGSECGMGFENWDDFEVGDQVQCFEAKEERRTLY